MYAFFNVTREQKQLVTTLLFSHYEILHFCLCLYFFGFSCGVPLLCVVPLARHEGQWAVWLADIYLPCCGAPVDPQLLHSVDISGFVPSGSSLCGSGCPCVAAKYFLPTSRVMAAMDNFQDGGRGQRNHPCVHFLQKFSTFCSILQLVTSIESHAAVEAFDQFLPFHFHQR